MERRSFQKEARPVIAERAFWRVTIVRPGQFLNSILRTTLPAAMRIFPMMLLLPVNCSSMMLF